jgi:uncharacterized protein (TIGR02246 family)
MKIPVLITIAGLMIGFAAPTFAQQKEPSLTEQDREQILEIGKKNDEAWSKSDATALAALFTVDAVFVTPAGILVGREAIEQRYQTVFKDLEKRLGTDASGESNHIVNTTKVAEMHAIDDNTEWGVGQWSQTIPGPNHRTKQVHGNWGCVSVRDGDTWKNRMLTVNVSPAPPSTSPAVAQQPDPQLRERLISRIKAHTDALDKNDAAAVAANFTEDAVSVEQDGTSFGREAIQKVWADRFQKVHFSNNVATVDEDSPHVIGTDGKQMWATGAWSATIKGENWGPTEIKGFWSVIREGPDWNIRMLTSNVTPTPAK